MGQLVSISVLALVAFTTVIAYVVGTRALNMSRRALRGALRQTLELAGLTVVFLLVNLGLGVGIVLVSRDLIGRFISVYVLNDISLVGLSALQAVAFGCWRLNDQGARARES
ncbi:MAG TPA: hypothetical protein VJX92_28355 [Methylomirabilota bacterium]|nr:hypothetical protein [Methylomirabilota bacterium]